MEISKILDENLYKNFNVLLPADFLNGKVRASAEKRQKNYKLDGFRQGKVPVEEIIKRDGDAIFYSIIDDVINEAVNKIVDDNELKLSIRPEVDFGNDGIERNKDINIKVCFELMPKIENLDLNKIKVNKYKINIKEDDIEESFKKIINNYRKLEKKDDSAASGDTVSINFEGFVNNEPFNGGKGEDFKLQLGSKTFIDGFEEQLIGKKAGDKVDVNVRFPDTYHSSELAGKDALFKVDILEVLAPANVEVDDEFVRSNLGIETVDKLKEIIKTELENNYSSALLNKSKEELINEIDKCFNFELPKKSVQNRIENIKNHNKNLSDDEAKKEAEKTSKCSYVILSVGEQNNIQVNDSEMTEAIMKQVSYFPGKEREFIERFKKDQNLQDSLRAQLLEDKIINFILDKTSGDNIKEITIEEFAKL